MQGRVDHGDVARSVRADDGRGLVLVVLEDVLTERLPAVVGERHVSGVRDGGDLRRIGPFSVDAGARHRQTHARVGPQTAADAL